MATSAKLGPPMECKGLSTGLDITSSGSVCPQLIRLFWALCALELSRGHFITKQTLTTLSKKPLHSVCSVLLHRPSETESNTAADACCAPGQRQLTR
eukprot:2607617-Amphidinium_carterae.2